MLDRLMEDDVDYASVKEGETYKENTVFTKENGLETRKNVKSKIRVENGVPHETKIEEYIFPNGEKDIVRTYIVNGNIEKETYHLKKGE